MRIGAFDTDSAALAKRLEAHDRYGSEDINAWALELLDAADGHAALELGCGRGKQTIPLAQTVGPRGHVTAVDASGESLSALREAAAEAGVAERVTTLPGKFDALAQDACEHRFDRVLSCYALYYCRDVERVMEAVHARLGKGGVLFFCGPSATNNAELRTFHFQLSGVASAPETPAQAFMERVGPEAAAHAFGAPVERFAFENPLCFDSAAALHDYWSSYNLFDPALDERFRAAAEKHFARQPTFETVKRAIGIRVVTLT